MTISYPYIVRDDAGALVSGATVTVTSVVDKTGTAISTPGATVNITGSNVTVDYDAELKGEAWITLAVSKVGSTFTGENAAPSIFASKDSGRVLFALPVAATETTGGLAGHTTVAKNATVAKPGDQMALTDAAGELLAVKVDQHLLDQTDGVALVNAIVAAIGNTNVDQAALTAAVVASVERTGGKLDGIATNYARRTGDYATAQSIANLGTPQQAGQAVTLPATPPAGYATTTKQDQLKTVVDGIVTTADENQTAVLEAIAGIEFTLSPTERNSLASAILTLPDGVEGGLTLAHALQAIFAVNAGKTASANGTSPKFRNAGDTKNRVSATLDGDGNRTAVVLSYD